MLVLKFNHKSVIGAASRHSTTAPSTPFFRRRARISCETSWAVSAEVEPGMTPTHRTTGPRLPFASSPSGAWVKKRARSMDDHLIF